MKGIFLAALLLLSGCASARSFLADTSFNVALPNGMSGSYQSNKNQDIKYEEYDANGKLLRKVHVTSVTPEAMFAYVIQAQQQQAQTFSDFVKVVIPILEKLGANFIAPGAGALIPTPGGSNAKPNPSTPAPVGQ